MEYQHLLVQRDGPFVTITLDWPQRRNALALDVLGELEGAFAEVGDSDATGVILAATGPVFSAGHDLAEMRGATLDDARALFVACTRTMDRIQQVPQVVVARVHALATAAGCQLVASCDLAVAARTAAFAIPGGRGGLFCHTPLVAVARNVGRKRALEMAFTGDPIGAEQAAEWGLINNAVDDELLEAATLDLLRRATRGSAASKALGKQGFYAQIGLDQPSAYALMIETMAAAVVGEDGQENAAAFVDKRPARWAAAYTH